MKRCTWLKPCLWAAIVALLVCGLPAWAQGQTAAPSAPAAAPAPPPIAVDAPLNVSGPSADDQAAGDPSGTKTGTANDVVHADPTKPLTLVDLVNQAGQNRIAINFTWTLVAGLPGHVHAGRLRHRGNRPVPGQERQPHHDDELHGVRLRPVRLLGVRLRHPDGRRRRSVNLGGASPLSHEFTIHLLGQDWGLWGTKGFFLTGATYDVGVMVSVPVPDGLHGHGADHRDRRGGRALEVRRFLRSRPCSWARSPIRCSPTGRGAAAGWPSSAPTSDWATAMPTSPDRAWCTRSAASPRLALAMIIGPRIGKYNRDGSSNAMPGHDIVIVLTGCFILAFGWFGFNPGSTLGASGALRISSIAVNTMLAGWTGSFGAMLYMWIRYGKPDASMTGNGLLAGLVAITAPSGFVNTVGAAIIGFVAGVLVCVSVEFVDRVLKVDDPVGAISVHGTNGLWGVISVGLFADGTNGVKGLFYGDPTQLVAQLIGVATLLGFVFSLSYVREHGDSLHRRTAVRGGR